jgi:hypothetical protein
MLTTAALFGSFLFGLIGMAAFAYGKKESRVYPMLFGAALMAFPYFVTNTWALYGVGAGLTGMLVKMRDY